MNITTYRKILKDNDFVHVSGTDEELKVARNLLNECEKRGVAAHLEDFDVEIGNVREASLTVNGKQIACEGYKCCGSGSIEAPFCYLPDTDPASLTRVKGKIVLLDTSMKFFLYQDLMDNGALGFITYDGNVQYRDNDIDKKELRSYVRGEKGKILGVNINAKDAVKLVASAPETVKICVEQDEYGGQSHNVVAEIPGQTDEYIVLTAHYDTTPLSHGSYDNMTGCVGLIGVMEELQKTAPNRYGVRFIFCGSEERGLLGSKAYCAAHEAELPKIALNINLDMIGTWMGHFIACVTAEERLLHYIQYYCSLQGWGIAGRTGVYASDSTPFADKGVPSLSFARLAPGSQATIHNRYDTMNVLSMEQLKKDTEFIAGFTAAMVTAVKCPVDREIPEKIKKELDEYLNRKRKKG